MGSPVFAPIRTVANVRHPSVTSASVVLANANRRSSRVNPPVSSHPDEQEARGSSVCPVLHHRDVEQFAHLRADHPQIDRVGDPLVEEVVEPTHAPVTGARSMRPRATGTLSRVMSPRTTSMSTSVTGAFGAAGSSPNGGGSRVGAASRSADTPAVGSSGFGSMDLPRPVWGLGDGNFRGENGNIRNGCGYFKSNENLMQVIYSFDVCCRGVIAERRQKNSPPADFLSREQVAVSLFIRP